METKIKERIEEILSDLIGDPRYEKPCAEMLDQVRHRKFSKRELHTIYRLIHILGKEHRERKERGW